MSYTIPLDLPISNMVNLYSFVILIIAITIHEFSHAFAADRLGDPTPRSFGRLSLNPLRHADPIGTFLLPLMGLLSGLPTIGWAKPVPIDPYNFRHPKRDELIVALAGPLSNLSLAIIFALLYHLLNFPLYLAYIPIVVNASLALFNLLPIPPLDGSHVFLNLLPVDQSIKWQAAFDQYGTWILLAFIFLPIGGTSLVNLILTPLIKIIISLLI